MKIQWRRVWVSVAFAMIIGGTIGMCWSYVKPPGKQRRQSNETGFYRASATLSFKPSKPIPITEIIDDARIQSSEWDLNTYAKILISQRFFNELMISYTSEDLLKMREKNYQRRGLLSYGRTNFYPLHESGSILVMTTHPRKEAAELIANRHCTVLINYLRESMIKERQLALAELKTRKEELVAKASIIDASIVTTKLDGDTTRATSLEKDLATNKYLADLIDQRIAEAKRYPIHLESMRPTPFISKIKVEKVYWPWILSRFDR